MSITIKKRIKGYYKKHDKLDDYQRMLKSLWNGKNPDQYMLKRDEPIGLKIFIAICTFSGITPKQLSTHHKEIIDFKKMNKEQLEAIPYVRIIKSQTINEEVLHYLDFDFSKSPFNSNQGNIFMSFSEWKRNGRQADFIPNYFKCIKEKIETTNNELVIYDYYLNSPESFRTHKQEYFEEYRKYYQVIEDLSCIPNITYTRILAVPRSLDKVHRTAREDHSNYHHKTLLLLFQDTYEHIVRSYKLFGNRFQLHITNWLSRSYSLMLIDSNYLLSEYYRINRNRIAVPDILFVENVKKYGFTESMYDAYYEELMEIKEGSLSAELLESKTITALDNVDLVIKSLTSSINNIDTNSETQDTRVKNERDKLVRLKNDYDMRKKNLTQKMDYLNSKLNRNQSQIDHYKNV